MPQLDTHTYTHAINYFLLSLIILLIIITLYSYYLHLNQNTRNSFIV